MALQVLSTGLQLTTGHQVTSGTPELSEFFTVNRVLSLACEIPRNLGVHFWEQGRAILKGRLLRPEACLIPIFTFLHGNISL